MCNTRQTRFRCGHSGPALLTRSCRHQFDYARARCRGGRDSQDEEADRDIYLHPDNCPGCRAARLGIVQPAGWRPLPLGISSSSQGSASQNTSSSHSHPSRKNAEDEEENRRKGGKTGNFVRFIVSDEDDNRDDAHYQSSRSRRPPKTTGWRYREEAAREQDANREGARMRKLYRERAKGEEILLRTLVPGTEMVKGKGKSKTTAGSRR